MYVDASVAGLWRSDMNQEPRWFCRLSLWFSVVWRIKQQETIALSSMEAEYITLSNSQSMKHSIVVKLLTDAIALGLAVDLHENTSIRSTVFQDKTTCLTLAQTKAPKMTRMKYFGSGKSRDEMMDPTTHNCKLYIVIWDSEILLQVTDAILCCCCTGYSIPCVAFPFFAVWPGQLLLSFETIGPYNLSYRVTVFLDRVLSIEKNYDIAIERKRVLGAARRVGNGVLVH
jgi:hypothetical protein